MQDGESLLLQCSRGVMFDVIIAVSKTKRTSKLLVPFIGVYHCTYGPLLQVMLVNMIASQFVGQNRHACRESMRLGVNRALLDELLNGTFKSSGNTSMRNTCGWDWVDKGISYQ